MAHVVASTAVLVLLGLIALSSATPRKLELPDLSKLAPESIYFFPLADEKCGEGNPMFYGIITPKKIDTTKKFWIESMGGAICFNEASCNDKEFNVWLDLLKTMKRYIHGLPPSMGTVETLYPLLTSGQPFPISMMKPFDIAYFPSSPGDPLEGEVGFYYPSCTADAGLGNHKVTYNSSQVIHHSGGASYMLLLEAIQQAYTDIERMTLIGASGSAVSRLAWAPTVADMFPTAEVHVLADSAMHVLPGTDVFRYFWNEVQWSPNPDGRHDLAQLYAPDLTSLPMFDWRSPLAISDMLRQYGGRIKVMYLGCNHDEIVTTDRQALAEYAQLTVPTSPEAIAEGMWAFLQNLTRDAPAGSVFSYISEGTCHHETRENFADSEAINASDPNDVGPKKFTEAFLKGEFPAAGNIWCCNKKPSAPATAETGGTDVSLAVSRMPSLIAVGFAAVWASFAAIQIIA